MKIANSKKLLNGVLIGILSLSTQAGVLISPAHAAPPSNETASADPQMDAKSAQVMKAVGTFYKDMKGFTQTMSTEMKISAADKQTAMTSVFKVSFGRPNKFYLKLESGKMGSSDVALPSVDSTCILE